ncbi:helix-turn-helix domain-containing protein [Sutcliffiella horikoshii]
MAKNPQKPVIYQQVVEKLKSDASITAIAKEHAITRQTVYRIKKELEN